MAAVFVLSLFAVFTLGYCGNYTVTEEAWFDVEVKDLDGPGEDYRGRIVIALFGETAPMTAMNFAAIAKGIKRGRNNLHYKNSKIHRVVPDFLIQMGDVTVGDGTGGKSIFGDKFVDENFIISHKNAGVVSMANHGKDTNGSQFFILLTKARWLDGKHVAFGKVIKGMQTLWYKNTKIHRVVPDLLIQMGDITVGDGTGGKSIYGDKFLDEDFTLSHANRGVVSMANHGKDTNGSQFFILLTKARWLNGKHVVFGKVIQGMDVLEILGDVPADPNTAVPKRKMVIIDSGVNGLREKYNMSQEQFESDSDVSN